MADFISITPGSGENVATDEIDSKKYQRIKLITGADGVNDGDVASGNPLPVDVKSAIPAGTNAIGKLAANAGINIGDVNVNDISAGTQTNDVKVTLDSESVAVTNAGLTELAAAINTSKVDCNVSGTVTAELSATDNTVLDNIDTSLNNIESGQLADGHNVTIDNAASAAAVNIQDGGNSITVDGTVTANLSATDNAVLDVIAGDTTSIDGKITACNTGNVTIGAALPAGSNAIGKLATNTGVDIGDVDVTSIVPGTAATNLGKAEDTQHASGDVGIMPLAVRNDTLAALGGADGDYAPLQVNAAGGLYVDKLNRITNGTAHAAGELTEHTDSSAITTAGYNQITIYWDITAITGTWKLVLRAYDSDSNEYYEIAETADYTGTADVRLTFPICDPIVDIRLQEEAAGAMTSSVRYHLRA